MSELTANLKTTLDNLGKTERTKPAESQDKIDEVAHEFSIAAFLRSYGDKRYGAAKDMLLATLGPVVKERLDKSKADAKKQQSTQNLSLANAAFHDVGARVVIGSSAIDETGLREELNTIIGEHNTDLLFKKYKKQRDPTVTFLVTEHG